MATPIPACTLRAMNLLAGIQIGATRMSVRQIQLRSQRSVRAQLVTDARLRIFTDIENLRLAKVHRHDRLRPPSSPRTSGCGRLAGLAMGSQRNLSNAAGGGTCRSGFRPRPPPAASPPTALPSRLRHLGVGTLDRRTRLAKPGRAQFAGAVIQEAHPPTPVRVLDSRFVAMVGEPPTGNYDELGALTEPRRCSKRCNSASCA